MHIDPLLRQGFAGRMRANGYVEDLNRRIRNQFDAVFDGQLTTSSTGQEILRLNEQLRFADGSEESKSWEISAVREGRMVAQSPSLLSLGTIERVGGNALRWRYDIAIPVNGKSIRVAYDDMMVVGADGIISSTATIKKFGFTLARTVVVYVPEAYGSAQAA